MSRRTKKSLDEIAQMVPVETKQAADRLIGFLQSNDHHVRQAAAEALGQSNKKYPVPALIRALQDPHHQVRWSVVQSLGWIGDARAVLPLVERALYDPDSDVCLAAVAALQWIDDPEAIPGLLAATQHTDTTVAKAALGAIIRYDERAVPYLQDLAATGTRAEQQIAATILDRIHDPPPLAEAAALPEYEPTRTRLPHIEDESLSDSDLEDISFVSVNRLNTPRKPITQVSVVPGPAESESSSKPNLVIRPQDRPIIPEPTDDVDAPTPPNQKSQGTTVLSLLTILAGLALLIVGETIPVDTPITIVGLAIMGAGALLTETGHLWGGVITRIGLLAMSLGALTAGIRSVISVLQSDPIPVVSQTPLVVISGVLILVGLRVFVEALWRGS